MSNEFKARSWDEQPPPEGHVGPRVAHAHTVDEFTGVIEGEAVNEYVMSYSGQGDGFGSGSYVGFGQITGTVDGRKGSFVVRHNGTFEGTAVRGSWSVVPGFGTGDLTGLRGEGGFVSGHGESATSYTFEQRFE